MLDRQLALQRRVALRLRDAAPDVVADGGDAAADRPGAFATVGLSRDTSPGLSVVGKLAMVALMFLGRVGLPTVASALTVAAFRPPDDFRYAQEDVVVG